MIEQIRAALVDVAQAYRDTRTRYCQVEASELAGEWCGLTGTVLDEATLTAVTHTLATQFPTITFDKSGVQILRQSQPKLLTVSTNLAGVHRQPSRTTERVSEVLNGVVVELLMEQNGWVFVRQMDGYLGWVYRPYLTESPPPPPTHIVTEPVSLLRAEPDAEARLVSRVMVGTKVAVTAVSNSWAHLVLAGERDGWVPAAHLRSLDALPQDENGRRQQMVEDSAPFIGVQYLWGGCTGQGIDCSGLAQVLHRMVGIDILRDADMQLDAGMPVEPPFQAGDLLFFGSDKGHRAITHVAMSLGGWKVIHSSGPRNGVYEDDVQAVSWLRDSFVGACTYVSAPNGD
jgi:cell wall-associated NlpC family hydrolase